MAFGLFKKKKDKKLGENNPKIIIKEVQNVAKETVNIVFEKPSDFHYEAGQFITIIHKVNGKKIRRAYSLSTSPFIDENPAVTVKRVPNGLMSNFLNDKVKTGDELEIMNPMGMFVTSYHPENERKIVLLGGGSGITPLISIGKSVLAKEPKSSVSLVFVNRSEEYIIFKEDFEKLAKKYEGRFSVTHILTQGKNADYIGRPTEATISEICDKIGCDDKSEFFICGPQPLMDLFSSTLENKQFPKENIKMESFDVAKTPDLADDSSEKSTVTIILNEEEHSLTIKKNEMILAKALDNELDMPYSCQSGVCTACRGKCVEGEVTTNEAEGLNQEELEQGYVLTCVARPLTENVKIDME